MKLISLFFCGVFYSSVFALIIETPSESAGEYESPEFRFTRYTDGASRSASGQFIRGNPFDGCSPQKNPETFEGKIIVIDLDGCSPGEKAKKIQESSQVIGIVVAMNKKGIPGYHQWSEDFRTSVPVVTVSKETGELLLKGNNVTGIIFPTPNPWNTFARTPMIILQAISLPFGLTNMLLGIHKFHLIYSLRGFSTPIPLLSLFFDFMSNLIRFVAFIDPYIYGIFPYAFTTWSYTGNLSWALMNNILVIIVWQISIKATLKMKSRLNVQTVFLKKMAIPFFLFFFLLLALETTASILRGMFLGTSFINILVPLFYFALVATTTTVFFWKGTRVLRVIRASKNTSEKGIALKKATTRIIISGVFYIILVIALAFASVYYEYPVGWFTVTAIFAMSLNIASFLQLLANTVRNKESSSGQKEAPTSGSVIESGQRPKTEFEDSGDLALEKEDSKTPEVSGQ